MNKRVVYKRVVDRRMRTSGDVNYPKKRIRVNPRQCNLINTIIHEELHVKDPSLSETEVKEKASEIEAAMTIPEMIKLLKRYAKSEKDTSRKTSSK